MSLSLSLYTYIHIYIYIYTHTYLNKHELMIQSRLNANAVNYKYIDNNY